MCLGLPEICNVQGLICGNICQNQKKWGKMHEKIAVKKQDCHEGQSNDTIKKKTFHSSRDMTCRRLHFPSPSSLGSDVQRDVGGSEWEETDEEEGTEEEGCEWLWICVTGRHWLTWWQTLMLHVSLCDYCSKQLYLLSEKAAVKRKRRLQLLITTTSWDSPLSVRSFWN